MKGGQSVRTWTGGVLAGLVFMGACNTESTGGNTPGAAGEAGSVLGGEPSAGATGGSSAGSSGATAGDGNGGAAGALGGDSSSGATTNGGNTSASGASGESGAGGASEPSIKVTWLGACHPIDLSKDGKTVLAEEGLWTAATGWQKLPDLPGGAEVNQPGALARDPPYDDSNCRWPLDAAHNGTCWRRAWTTALSADGSQIAFYAPRYPGTFSTTGTCLSRLGYPYWGPHSSSQVPIIPSEVCGGEGWLAGDDGSYVYVDDGDDTFDHMVGIDFEMSDGDQQSARLFYLSSWAGMRPLEQVLPRDSGIQLPVTGLYNDVLQHHSGLFLSGDGSLLLGQDAAGQCFLTELRERTLCDGCSGLVGQSDTGPTDTQVERIGMCSPYALNQDGSAAVAGGPASFSQGNYSGLKARNIWIDGLGWSESGGGVMNEKIAGPANLTGKCLASVATPGASCSGYEDVIFSYSQDGTRAVGWEYLNGALDSSFFWSKDGGLVPLDEVIAGSSPHLSYPGRYTGRLVDESVDPPKEDQGHPVISGDGKKVLSRDEGDICFIAKLKP